MATRTGCASSWRAPLRARAGRGVRVSSLLGTRFYASAEALGHPRARRAIAGAGGGQTTRTRVFDAARGYRWPAPFTGRALRNAFLERWDGREDELVADEAARGIMPIGGQSAV
jgi:hypothetical protein